MVHLKTICGVISRCEDSAICRRQADRCWITRGSRNLDIMPFRTFGRIRASVTEGTNISQLCFPTCQIPQKTGCQGGQGSPRAVVPSEEEEEEEEDGSQRARLTTSPPSLSQLSRQCVIFNISQPYRPPWPVSVTVFIPLQSFISLLF
jgi:hypothetical protein